MRWRWAIDRPNDEAVRIRSVMWEFLPHEVVDSKCSVAG